MKTTKSAFLRVVSASLIGTLIASAAPNIARADFVVAPGWDLWETDAGDTNFAGIPFEGVPLDNFDFGGNVGVRNTFDTDTIVRRLEPLDTGGGPGAGTIPIELVALQLRSVDPVDLDLSPLPGTGIHDLFVTARPVQPQSFMSVQIDQDMQGGLYDPQLNVAFDLRTDALNGPIIFSDSLNLTLPGPAPWRRTPPPGVTTIKGVNHMLKPDMSQDHDFWPGHDPKDPMVYARGMSNPPPCQPHGESGTFSASHCITTTTLPPKPIKWSQRPEDHAGENIGSDFDWRQVMDPPPAGTPVAPNWTVADDFQSDGRPIAGVRWWGSYFNPNNQPQPLADGTFKAVIEDAFVVSFFEDIPADPADPNGFSRPGALLGTYTVPINEVKVEPTTMVGWDDHQIWEYAMHLEDAHPDHLIPGLTTPDFFFENAGDIYWVSIAAENGHFLDMMTWQAIDTGDPVEDQHFWGWHTSPDTFNDVPVMGDLRMPGQDWVYGNWEKIQPQHANFDMAFELKTPEPSSCLLLALGTLGGFGCRRRR